MTPDTPRVAVGAIVLKERSLLMVRRAKEPALGLWSVPGGSLEPGEYLAVAVAREVKEETGLDIEVGELAGIFEVPGEAHFVILDFLADPIDDNDPRPGDDVSEARWVPLDEIEKLECTPRLAETLRAWGILG